MPHLLSGAGGASIASGKRPGEARPAFLPAEQRARSTVQEGCRCQPRQATERPPQGGFFMLHSAPGPDRSAPAWMSALQGAEMAGMERAIHAAEAAGTCAGASPFRTGPRVSIRSAATGRSQPRVTGRSWFAPQGRSCGDRGRSCAASIMSSITLSLTASRMALIPVLSRVLITVATA